MKILIRTRAGTVEITDNVGHTCLIAHCSSQVDRLLRVILNFQVVRTHRLESLNYKGVIYLGERFDFSAMAGSPFSRKETKRAVARSFVLTRESLSNSRIIYRLNKPYDD